MKEVAIVGEALIDLIDFDGNFSICVGGGPANTAKALARLGVPSCFVGGISSDDHGIAIEKELRDSGVNLNYINRSTLSTAVAKALIDEDGIATYKFELANTATFAFSSHWLPNNQFELLYVGSVATIWEPGASSLFEWASNSSAVVLFDPNVRTSIQDNRDVYRSNVEKWVSISDVVKLSDEDLSWLYRESEAEVINSWLNSGVSLIVVTLGAFGLRAYTKEVAISLPSTPVSLVDTVGAGDTINAILLEGIANYGLHEVLEEKVLREILKKANRAAGITCSRVGANPPWAFEL